MGFYHLRKTMLGRDFPHLFGCCFLHWFLPGLGIENDTILGAFGHYLLIFVDGFTRRLSKAIFEPWRSSVLKSPLPGGTTLNAKSMFLPIQVISSSLSIDFPLGRPNYKRIQKQKMVTWALQARARLTKKKKRNCGPRDVKKEATYQIWAPFRCHFGIIFSYFSYLGFRIVSFSVLAGFLVLFWVHSSDSGLLSGTILLSFSDRCTMCFLTGFCIDFW